jgi:hypothetical protein
MKEIDKQMKPDNTTNMAPANATNATANATASADKDKKADDKKADEKKKTLAERKSLHRNLLAKAATTVINKTKGNSTDEEENIINFDEVFDAMNFTVNDTMNMTKGWPVRKDDGFPYQE